MRALSSAKVFSLSSYLGGSMPLSRAPAFLAKSQALCTWPMNRNMSGKSRAVSSTVGSILFASAYASALSRIAESALRPISNIGTDALYIDMAQSSLHSFGVWYVVLCYAATSMSTSGAFLWRSVANRSNDKVQHAVYPLVEDLLLPRQSLGFRPTTWRSLPGKSKRPACRGDG